MVRRRRQPPGRPRRSDRAAVFRLPTAAPSRPDAKTFPARVLRQGDPEAGGVNRSMWSPTTFVKDLLGSMRSFCHSTCRRWEDRSLHGLKAGQPTACRPTRPARRSAVRKRLCCPHGDAWNSPAPKQGERLPKTHLVGAESVRGLAWRRGAARASRLAALSSVDATAQIMRLTPRCRCASLLRLAIRAPERHRIHRPTPGRSKSPFGPPSPHSPQRAAAASVGSCSRALTSGASSGVRAASASTASRIPSCVGRAASSSARPSSVSSV
jgi:hypothetical protein